MERRFRLTQDYIELGQLLKALDLVASGGEVKEFLVSHSISVNQEPDNRRGRKLRSGDTVSIDGGAILLFID